MQEKVDINHINDDPEFEHTVSSCSCDVEDI